MNRRLILVIAAMAICGVTAPGRGLASADKSASGFDTDRTGTITPSATWAPDLSAALEAASADGGLGTNPLWGIPLETLNITRDRPLFSPARRAAAAAAIRPPAKAAKAVSPSAAPKPALNLVGTVQGNSVSYAIFVDTTTHNTVRFKTGEGEDGWILQSVSEREAVLHKNDRNEVLELPPIKRRSK